MNRRQRALWLLIAVACLLLALALAGLLLPDPATDFSAKNQPPSLRHPFGTDWVGRDMLVRTVKGLSTSMLVGIVASAVSAVLAAIVGTAAAALPKGVDRLLGGCVDLTMGIPHIVLMILISFALGGGLVGVVVAVAAVHWPNLSRVIRGEVLQVRGEPYVALSRHFGRSRGWLMAHHFLPHLLPQFAVGLVLLFPHAILHEASITFLGFGLSPEQPAVGVILAESMGYLSAGYWHLALFPGLMLVAVVLLFEALGAQLRLLADPGHAQE